MEVEVYKALQPLVFFQKHFEQRKRVDGREFNELRTMQLDANSIETADSSFTVKLGSTIVIGAVKAQVSIAENGGSFSINIDLPALCCDKYKGAAPHPRSQALSYFYQSLLTQLNVIELDTLLIGEDLAWNLFFDIVCLNDDGNVLNAGWKCISGLLENLTVPDVGMDDSGCVTVISDQRFKLHFKKIPEVFYFGVYNGKLLVDLTEFEEKVISDFITVIVDNDEIIQIIIKGKIDKDLVEAAKIFSLSANKQI